jgi:hypothetical protein
MKELKPWMKDEVKRRNRKVKRKNPFFPSDIKDLHNPVTTAGYQMKDAIFYAMVLNGLVTVVRFNGLQDTSFSNFEDHSSLWKIINSRVEKVAQMVREKHHDDWFVYLHGFRDTHQKECFLKLLLVIVHCIDGFIYSFDSDLAVFCYAFSK